MYQKNPFLKKSYRFNRIKKKDNPEGRLTMQIIYYLKTIGCAAVGKIKTLGIKKDGHYCKDYYLMRGKADIECFRKAIMYCIECKSLTGVMSDDQKSYRDVFHKPPDRIYILARRLEDVSEVIK